MLNNIKIPNYTEHICKCVHNNLPYFFLISSCRSFISAFLEEQNIKKMSHIMTGNIPNTKTLPRVTWPQNLFVKVWNLMCAFFPPYVLRLDVIDWLREKRQRKPKQ